LIAEKKISEILIVSVRNERVDCSANNGSSRLKVELDACRLSRGPEYAV